MKKELKKIFSLPIKYTPLIAIPCFVLQGYVLAKGTEGALAYLSYLLSTYALIITLTALVRAFPRLIKFIDESAPIKRIKTTKFGARFFGDVVFRMKLSLYVGIIINIIYIIIKLITGVVYGSKWFSVLSAYYFVLLILRITIIGAERRSPVGSDIVKEYGAYRICGVILLIMNIVLATMVVLVIFENNGFDYPGILIFAMAFYSFYAVITAIINTVKSKKHGSPLITASKIVSLTAALVSMLSLEIAMTERFGGDALDFRQMMTAVTGGSVCLIVLIMAVYMIIKAGRKMQSGRY